MSPDLAGALGTGARWLGYAGVLGVVGANAFVAAVLTAVPRDSVARPALDRSAASLGLAGALALLAALLIRLVAQTLAFFGGDEGLTPETLRIVLFDLAWGRGWLWQGGSALLAVAGLVWVRRRGSWLIARLGALGVAVTVPLTGHAIAGDWSWLTLPLQATHVLATAVWLGGLLLLVLAVASPSGRGCAAAMVDRFSPLALVAATVAGATGTVTATLYVGTWDGLWTSPYGRVLVAKLLFVGGVAAVGFINWRRIRPRLKATGNPTTLARTASVELGLAVVVLALTAMLVGLAQPGD